MIKFPGYIQVERELGRGGFGIVLQILNTKTSRRYALKLEMGDSELIRTELRAYDTIHRCALGGKALGILNAKLINLSDHKGLLMDLKGPSLQFIMDSRPQDISLKVIYMVAH